MGAYENPLAVIDRSDEILQAGFASFSSSITNAFVEQQKKAEEFAKKKQQEVLNYQRYYGKNQAQTEAEMARNKKMLGNLDEKWVNSGRGIFGKVDEYQAIIDSSTDIDVVKEASANLRMARKAETNYMDAVTDLNELVGTVSEQQSASPYSGKAGDIDRFDPTNATRIKVSQALNGTIPSYKEMEINPNEDGDIIATFYLETQDEGGNSVQEEFKFNVTQDGDAESAAKVSDLSKTLTTAASLPTGEGGLGILDSKGNLDAKYFERDANNEIKTKNTSETYTDPATGQTIVEYYEENVVDEKALNGVISSFVASQVNGQTDKQKLSAFNNSFSSMVGQDITYQKPGTNENVTVTITDDLFDFKDGQDQFTADQQSMFTAMTESWYTASLNTKPERRKIGTRTVSDVAVKAPDTFAGEIFEDIQSDPATAFTSVTGKKASYDANTDKVTTTELVLNKETNEYEEVPVVYDLSDPGMLTYFYNTVLESTPGYLGGQSGARQSQEMQKLVKKLLKERQESADSDIDETTYMPDLDDPKVRQAEVDRLKGRR